MTAKYNGPNGRIKKSEERQSELAQVEGVTLKGNFEQRRSGWGNEEISHLVLNVEVLINLKHFVPFGLPKDERLQVFRFPPKARKKMVKENKRKER